MTKKQTMTVGTVRRAVRNLALLAAVAMAIGAWAETETVGGYTWTYQINGDTAEINNNYSAAISPTPTGAVTIPSTLGGKPVTSIGSSAFFDCSGLESVTIPNSVTNIGASAFLGCCGLTSVTIPDSVTNIGSLAFSGCSGLTSVTLPNALKRIEVGAFNGCTGLTTLVIPDSVVDICDCLELEEMLLGYGAFSRCSGLTSVTIPDSVTNIGNYAFYNCTNLTSVTIGNGVTSIGYDAFDGCNGIKSVVVPQYVLDSYPISFLIGSYQSITNVAYSGIITNIGSYAFSDCCGLTSVTIPDSVTNIGSSAFSGCSGLTSVTIGNGVTSIGYDAFENCSGLTGVHITDLVKWCGIAFSGADANPLCSAHNLYLNGEKVMNLMIPGSVTSIGDRAFYGCSGLTSVTIPDSVTSIGSSAFYGCSGLTSVSIPNSVAFFGPDCFEGCPVFMRKLCQTILGAGGGSPSVATAVVQQVEAPYALTDHAADRAIASVTVDGDCAIDEFVLKDGKVYDCVLRIVNVAEQEVTLTLPAGYEYEAFKGAKPLRIPANSRNILTITRTADATFLVSREELETIQ